jgi:hypothetical protein
MRHLGYKKLDLMQCILPIGITRLCCSIIVATLCHKQIRATAPLSRTDRTAVLYKLRTNWTELGDNHYYYNLLFSNSHNHRQMYPKKILLSNSNTIIYDVNRYQLYKTLWCFKSRMCYSSLTTPHPVILGIQLHHSLGNSSGMGPMVDITFPASHALGTSVCNP